MRQTERRRRIVMVVSVVTGTLMLTLSAVLVGEAFTGTSLNLIGMPGSMAVEPRPDESAALQSRTGSSPRTSPPHRQHEGRPTQRLPARPTARPTPLVTPRTGAPPQAPRTGKPTLVPSQTALPQAPTVLWTLTPAPRRTHRPPKIRHHRTPTATPSPSWPRRGNSSAFGSTGKHQSKDDSSRD